MSANLKTILAAVSAVAVLASPVLAKTPERHHSAVVEPYGAAQTVYAPDLRLPATPYQRGGINPDFQLSHP
jgi:hypothetical protein